MTEQEGVTRYELAFHQSPPLRETDIARLDGWRRLLRPLGLIGADPARYGGLGFGNMSCRLPPVEQGAAQTSFLITGTQTGHLEWLGPAHYAVVTHCQPEANRLSAHGPVRPSSEALTHGALYAADAGIRWVFHAHDPHIWQRATALGLAVTDPAIPYGTPAMAEEVARLGRLTAGPDSGILAMGGHEDGILAWGNSPEAAGNLLLHTLARAFTEEVDHDPTGT